jgi:hypothetical protein
VVLSTLEEVLDINMNNQILINKVQGIVGMLSTPVSASEAADGWTSESKKLSKMFFEKLEQEIQSGESLPPMNISRSLDHYGVIGGEILEIAAQISNELRTLRKE